MCATSHPLFADKFNHATLIRYHFIAHENHHSIIIIITIIFIFQEQHNIVIIIKW